MRKKFSKVQPPCYLYCVAALMAGLHFYVDTTQCSPGAIRLSGGRDQFEGRVEVCSNNGLWGTVNRLEWDSLDAKVACRQLGLYQEDGRTSKLMKIKIASLHGVYKHGS